MASTAKFEELAGLAFENAIRLHIDATEAYKRESFATAYQLAITASEEIGKSLLLEEYVFQTMLNGWNATTKKEFLSGIFNNHRSKQKVFAAHANMFLRRHKLRNASTIITPLMRGIGEQDKQDSTYVGLTRDQRGKVNLNGKIILPRLFAQPLKAKRQITLNNDFLLVYIDGFLRGIYSTDSYSIACLMEEDTLEILNDSWTDRSRLAAQILKEHERHQKVEDPLADWN